MIRALHSGGHGAAARCHFNYERQAIADGYRRIAGCDEAGRGCLFGPVYAAAVVLNPEDPIPGVADSKQLDAARREELAAEIHARALAWKVASADASEIDRVNILQASRLAMKRAVQELDPPPDYLLVDAVALDFPRPQRALVKGDARSRSIAAASILAKTARDACMREWDAVYPQYGLCRHKGYGTAEHLEALERHGPTPQHRMSFAPVRQLSLFISLRETHAAGRR